jgi:endoglucanase
MKHFLKKCKLFSLIFTFIIINSPVFTQKAISVKKETTTDFAVHRGVNISHWLSQVFKEIPPRNVFFSELDIVFIKHCGFDHIRLPVDEIELWDDQGNKKESAFHYLKKAIEWCKKYNLKVIIDLHTVRSHHFNAQFKGDKNSLFEVAEEQEKFCDLWKQLSSEIGHYGNHFVTYELLNEAVADDPEDWNKLLAKCLAVIRELEPKRTIVIGSNRWQIPDTFPYLKVPENDPNIILSFHFYTPMPVTHYKAGWTPFKAYSGPISYPGIPINDELLPEDESEIFYQYVKRFNQYYDKSTLEATMMPAIKYAREKGLPLYCGEWGCFKALPRDILLKWYTDMVDIFNRYNISRANWDYKGEFAIFIEKGSLEPDWELIKILVNN